MNYYGYDKIMKMFPPWPPIEDTNVQTNANKETNQTTSVFCGGCISRYLDLWNNNFHVFSKHKQINNVIL